MDEITFLQDLAGRAAPAIPVKTDLRPGVWEAIARRQEAERRHQRLLRMWSVTGACGIAAAAMLTIGLYALQDMVRDLSWNTSVMSLISF